MSTKAPSYLKLHRGETTSQRLSRASSSSSEQFWTAFSAATGWRLDVRHGEDGVRVLPATETDAVTTTATRGAPPVVEENATNLARLAADMSREIEQLRAAVRRQEVELAAHAAIEISPLRSEAAAEQIEQTLRLALEASGFDAAAIYLLDDDTQYLNTRFVVGLPDERLHAEPRMLRGSRGDLEALVEQAVLMDDLTGVHGETWNAPEDAGAAVCTPLLKGDLPIGTVWMFAQEPRELDSSHAAIATLASGQIASLLSDASRIRREKAERKTKSAIRDLSQWQHTSLPVGSKIAPGWFIDGMIESPRDWAIGWHAWDVLPDGSLMMAIAESIERDAGGALIAATARAALAAHSGYRHTPAQMLQRIGDTLWQTNSADQLISLLYARIDADTGEGEIAAAGAIGGIIANRYGYRPLIAAGTLPLASSVDVNSHVSTFNLNTGETLLAYGPGLQEDGIGQELLGCCLRKASQGKSIPLAVIRREMAAFPNRHERGLLAISRR